MRLLSVSLLLVTLCSLAAAQQATVIQGYATTMAVPALGTALFIPLIKTPEISLDQPNLVTGASNATSGLISGATNATLSMSASETVSAASSPASLPNEDLREDEAADTNNDSAELDNSAESRYLDLGGMYPAEVGVATLIGTAGSRGHATRSLTNDDVEKLNQETGTVKFKGKTEELR